MVPRRQRSLVIARSEATKQSSAAEAAKPDCFAALAMTTADATVAC